MASDPTSAYFHCTYNVRVDRFFCKTTKNTGILKAYLLYWLSNLQEEGGRRMVLDVLWSFLPKVRTHPYLLKRHFICA